MPLTTEQVQDALKAIEGPKPDTDIVQADWVKSVRVKDGNVRVDLSLPTTDDTQKRRLEAAIREAVGKLDDAGEVSVHFMPNLNIAHAAMGPLPQVANIIAVGAGKGGVGKSTVAVLLALGLQKAGFRVGLMDADVYGPSIPKMLGIESADVYLTEQKRLVPVDRAGLKAISIGLLIDPDKALVWRGPMVHGAIKQFIEQVEWGELDYLIVDLPPGTGDVPLTLAQTIPATGAVVVCTPQAVALEDARKAVRMYETLKITVMGLVENMSYFVAPDTGKKYDLFGEGGTRRAADELRLPFLGGIPINVAVRLTGDDGNPETLFDGNAEDIEASIAEIVNNLVGQINAQSATAGGPSLTMSD